MWGDSESASKNTSKPIFKYPKYSNIFIRIFENSLASDLVFVIINVQDLVKTSTLVSILKDKVHFSPFGFALSPRAMPMAKNFQQQLGMECGRCAAPHKL